MARQDEFFTRLQTIAPPPLSSTSKEYTGEVIRSNPAVIARFRAEANDPNTPEERKNELLQAIQEDAVANEQADRVTLGYDGTVSKADDVRFFNRYANIINQGALLGFGDELGSALNATLRMREGDSWSNRYNSYKRIFNNAQANYELNSPKEAFAGNMIGSLLLGGAKAPALLAKLPVLRNMSNTQKAVAAGGVTGFISGAGTGDEKQGGRFQNAVMNGIIDGVTSGGLSVVTPILSKTTQDLFENPMWRTLKDKDIDPMVLANSLNKQGSSAMILDDPRLSGLVEEIIKKGDDLPLNQLAMAVTQRQNNLLDEARIVLGNHTGNNLNYIQQGEGLSDALTKKAADAYAKAIAVPAQHNKKVVDLIGDPQLKDLVKRVKGEIKHNAGHGSLFNNMRHIKLFGMGRLKDTGLVVDKITQQIDESMPYLNVVNQDLAKKWRALGDEIGAYIPFYHPHLNKSRQLAHDSAEVRQAMQAGQQLLPHSVKSAAGKMGHQLGLLTGIQKASENIVKQGQRGANIFDEYGLFQMLSPTFDDQIAKTMARELDVFAKKSHVGRGVIQDIQAAKEIMAQNQSRSVVERALNKGRSAYNNVRFNKIIPALTATGKERDQLLTSLSTHDNSLLEAFYVANPIALDLATKIMSSSKPSDSSASKMRNSKDARIKP